MRLPLTYFNGDTMAQVKIGVTGAARTVTSKKDGKSHTFSDVYVFGDGPYPDKIQVYGAIPLPAGEYLVPALLQARNERLEVHLDFSKAKQV